MNKKNGFWKWWIFKGDIYHIIYKLLFIYSTIITLLFMLVIPLFFPKVYILLILEVWVNFTYVVVMLHGWLIALIFCVIMVIKTTYDEYKSEVRT